MAGDGPGVLDFVANSIQIRAAHYRERAAHLRALAEAEPVGRLRDGLAELADQFEQLAKRLTITRRI